MLKEQEPSLPPTFLGAGRKPHPDHRPRPRGGHRAAHRLHRGGVHCIVNKENNNITEQEQ